MRVCVGVCGCVLVCVCVCVPVIRVYVRVAASSPSPPSAVAPTVEWARHNHHGTAWGKTLKKVTHPDTVVYDDLCYEAMVKENIQLNHY